MNSRRCLGLAWTAFGCLIVYHAIAGFLAGDDFHYHYWGARRALDAGGDLFTKSWIYMPTASLVLMPLALLPYELADLIWFLLRVAALCAILRVAFLWATREGSLTSPRASWILWFATILVSRPILADFRHGQINIILFAAVSLGCYWCMASGFSTLLGGGLIALGGMLKGPPLLLLGFPLLQKRWKSLLGAIVVIAGLLLFAQLWFGAENNAKNWADWRATSHRKVLDHPWQERLISIPELVLFLGDRSGFVWSGESAQKAWILEAGILGALFLFLRSRRMSRGLGVSPLWDWSALGLGVALLSPMTGQHHLVCILPATVCVLAAVFGEAGVWLQMRIHVGAIVAAFALMMFGKVDPHGTWIFGLPNFSVLLGLALLAAVFFRLPTMPKRQKAAPAQSEFLAAH